MTSKTFLYSIFHGNLNYSSISPKSYDKIIDTCYWPVLDLIKQFKFKSGIEFPLNTILEIEKIDPLLIDEIKKLSEQNKIEIIASSKEQVVFPLVPKEINQKNLLVGKIEIENIFATKIKTAFINEQLFTSSLVPLYIKVGFENIITIWEWASKISNINNLEKFHPKFMKSNYGKLNVIWNSYISYQKFQRYVNGEIEKEDFVDYLHRNHVEGNDSCYPFYGSDMEIFGYKNPVLGLSGTGKEISRFADLLEQIESDKKFEFVLPSDILKKFPPKEEIDLTSAKFSILGKKQDKFTVTRWATCGRDNGKSNALCYNAFKKIKQLKKIRNNVDLNSEFSQLCDCWASDFRTHTVEEKYSKFHQMINTLTKKLDDELKIEVEGLTNKTNSDLIIYNPNDEDWEETPYEIKLRFKPKKFKNSFEVTSNNKKLVFQIEEKQKYKDGSLRSVKLVLQPTVKSKENIELKFLEKKEGNVVKIKTNVVTTKNVELKLLEKKGATIEELKFPSINKKPLLGLLEHGTFEDTKLSPDFFSGHTVTFDRNMNKITDLVKTEIFQEEGNDTIRKILMAELNLPFGHLKKIYYVYVNEPRVDLRLIFDFKEFKPAYFRTGIMTFVPDAFDKKDLQYSTHNGGDITTHKISENISQDESIDPRLSSSGCLGATEGIVDFGDNNSGVTIFTDKSEWYSVPMINFHNSEEKKFFFRISHSFSELDDTSMTWWKGRKEVCFTLLARKNKIESNEKICKMIFEGLVCKSISNEIIVEN